MNTLIKILVIITLLAIFLVISGVYLLHHIQYWDSYFLDYFNKQLTSLNINLKAKSIKGSLISGFDFYGVDIFNASNNKLICQTDTFLIRFSLLSFLTKTPTISKIKLKNTNIYLPFKFKTDKTPTKKTKKGEKNTVTTIKKVELNNLNIYNNDNIVIDSAFVRSKINIQNDKVTVKLNDSYLHIPTYRESFNLTNAQFVYSKNIINVEKFNLKNKSSIIKLSGIIDFLNLKGELDLNVQNIILSERFKTSYKFPNQDDFLNIKGKTSIEKSRINFYGIFSGKMLNKSLNNGVLDCIVNNDTIIINNLSARLENSSYSGKFFIVRDDTIYAKIQFTDASINQLYNFNTPLSSTGSIFITSKKVKEYIPIEFKIKTDFDFIKVKNQKVTDIKGKFLFKNNIVSITDTLFLNVYGNKIYIRGKYDLSSNYINAEAYAQVKKLSNFSYLIKSSKLTGKGNCYFNVSGDVNKPDIKGWIKIDSLDSNHFTLSDFMARFGYVYSSNKRFGNIDIEFSKAIIKPLGRKIPTSNIFTHIKNDTIFIDNLQSYDRTKSVSLSGKIIAFKQFIVDNLHANYHDAIIKNSTPIYIGLYNDTIKVKSSRVSIDSGYFEINAEIYKRKHFFINSRISNINIGKLTDILGVKNDIDGTLKSKVIVNFNKDKNAKALFYIDNFKYNGYSYNSAYGEISYNVNKILINRLNLIDKYNGILSISGYIRKRQPTTIIDRILARNDSISISIKSDSFDITYLDPVFFKGINKRGKINGFINVTGILNNPQLDINLGIKDPVFDKLDADTMYIKGRYAEKNLILTDAIIAEDSSNYKAYGFIPYSVSINPLEIKMLKDSTINVNISAKSNTLEFLTKYGQIFQNIIGDYAIALNLSNTPDSIVYRGNINAKTDVLYLSFIENPITSLVGSGIIENNKIKIISLSGFTKREKPQYKGVFNRIGKYLSKIFKPSSKKSSYPNITISGDIDISNPFKPVLNLNLNGKDLYFRTFLGEYEGIMDGNLKVTGNKTIKIEGEVNNKELIIRSELLKTSETEGSESLKNLAINIHINFPANLYIKSSMLDCQMEGELFLTKEINEPLQISGELHTRKGNFYYLGYKFVIEKGDIYFDPSLSSPQVDIIAGVNIAVPDTVTGDGKYTSEYVTVQISGELNNPTLHFISDKYSEADIIKYLAKVQTLESGLTGQQLTGEAVNIFGIYFERLLKNQITQLGLVDDIEVRTGGSFTASTPPEQWTIMLSRRLRSNLFLTYERSLSLTEPFQTFEIEYFINPNFSIVGNVDSQGLIHIRYKYKYRY
ncbi:MAG: translocation/assembly module TamB domain-containing protein [Candidatus Marinimicrobia bacterium]|nr:translocation/assembly module TamB domain-containing protein [Candidatus Neomarinimicrobiota bacterium]